MARVKDGDCTPREEGSDDQGSATETSCNEIAGRDREILVQPSKVEEMLQTRLDGDKEPIVAKGNFFGSFVTSCFYPVFRMWGGQKTSPCQRADEWEIPFSDIKELYFVGSGSQGAVFVGDYRGQQLAIKKVTEEKQTDIRHLQHLKHPNIVSFIGVCSKPPCYCIVMEYCPEGTLYDYLSREEEIPPAKVLFWARQIAKGMQYLHANKIIHRDLKSLNILIAENDNLKISDFGTSRAIGDKSTKMTFAGTAAWMAPELIRRLPCSNRVDVWSFGVLLWELLTQERPYNNIGAAAIIYGVGSGKLSLPIPAQCPEDLKALLHLCWHSKPRNRPSFKQILLQLDIVAGGFLSLPPETFIKTQEKWREEIEVQFKQMRVEASVLPELDDEMQAAKRREEELRHAKDVRVFYEQKLQRANKLYRRLSAKERDLDIREQQIKRREIVYKRRRSSKNSATASASDSTDSAQGPVGTVRRVKPQKKHSYESPVGPGFHDKVSSNGTLTRKESFLPVATAKLHTQDDSSDSDPDLSNTGNRGEEKLDITVVPIGRTLSSAGEESGTQPSEKVKSRTSPQKSSKKRSNPPGTSRVSSVPILQATPSDSPENDNSTCSPSTSYTSSLKMPTMAPFLSDETSLKGQSCSSAPLFLRADSNTEVASCSNDADGESDGEDGRGMRERGSRQMWSAESTSAGISSSSPDPEHDHTLSSRGTSPLATLSAHDHEALFGSVEAGVMVKHTYVVPRPTTLEESYSPAHEEAMFYASSPGSQRTPVGATCIVRQYFENVSNKAAMQQLEANHNSSSTELEDSGFQSPRGAVV